MISSWTFIASFAVLPVLVVCVRSAILTQLPLGFLRSLLFSAKPRMYINGKGGGEKRRERSPRRKAVVICVVGISSPGRVWACESRGLTLEALKGEGAAMLDAQARTSVSSSALVRVVARQLTWTKDKVRRNTCFET